MSAKHTHWGVEHLTSSSGRRKGWHLSLQSIRRTRSEAEQADLDHYVSLAAAGNREHLWDQWHTRRREGKLRPIKLRITKVRSPA